MIFNELAARKLDSTLRHIDIKFQRSHRTMTKSNITTLKILTKNHSNKPHQPKHFCLFIQYSLCLAIINTLRSTPQKRSIDFNDGQSTMSKLFLNLKSFFSSFIDHRLFFPILKLHTRSQLNKSHFFNTT